MRSEFALPGQLLERLLMGPVRSQRVGCAIRAVALNELNRCWQASAHGRGKCSVHANLKGRATVEATIKLKEQRQDGVAGGKLRIVVDGFNAPLTAGNYIDLVQRGFYNGMEIQRADGFVVQTGDPGPPVRLNISILRAW